MTAIAPSSGPLSTPLCPERRSFPDFLTVDDLVGEPVSPSPDHVLAIEQFEGGGMDARIARCHDATGFLSRLVLPGRYHAAGAGHDRDQRHHVMRLQFGFDDQIDEA